MTGFIFDLDGVVADTTGAHLRSWERLADEEGLTFDANARAAVLGRTREDSLDILLAGRAIDRATRLEWLVRKQAYASVELADMSPEDTLPGVRDLIMAARAQGIAIALASSSRNARLVLDRLQLTPLFDAIADGATVAHPKPAPDIFLWAARALACSPAQCVVFEDSIAGIDAALAGGFAVVAVGPDDPRATWRCATLAGTKPSHFLTMPMERLRTSNA